MVASGQSMQPSAEEASMGGPCGCSLREFLIFFCVFLIVVDSLDVYAAFVRASHNPELPFWGNATAPLVAGAPGLTMFDLVLTGFDLFFVCVTALAGAHATIHQPL